MGSQQPASFPNLATGEKLSQRVGQDAAVTVVAGLGRGIDANARLEKKGAARRSCDRTISAGYFLLRIFSGIGAARPLFLR